MMVQLCGPIEMCVLSGVRVVVGGARCAVDGVALGVDVIATSLSFFLGGFGVVPAHCRVSPIVFSV